jgi:hypothetical protein
MEERLLKNKFALKRQRNGPNSLTQSPLDRHRRGTSPLKRLTVDGRPQSPYAAVSSKSLKKPGNFTTSTSTSEDDDNRLIVSSNSMVLGADLALSNIRDERVEEDRLRKSGYRSRSAASPSGRVRHQTRRAMEIERAEEKKKNLKQEKLNLKLMMSEDKLSNEYRLNELKIRLDLDQQLFVFYASRFGPMSGVLYSQTKYPGILYEKVISDGCLVLQKWWRSIWPLRAKRKMEAATFMQCMFRGRKGRKNFKVRLKLFCHCFCQVL